MEYPVNSDFFLRFKANFNERDEFTDFILIDMSDGFKLPDKLNSEQYLGKSLTELFIENEDYFPGAKELYFRILPGTRKKLETFVQKLDRWYLINVFSDDNNYLLIVFTDITKIKSDRNKDNAMCSRESGQVVNIMSKTNFHCYRDNLTGLYNKLFFDEEVSRLDTERQLPISIIMGDLNGLKLINDAFGHSIGDEALKAVSKVMKNAFRKEDIVSRSGGDEFIVLLPKTPEKVSLSIIKRIKTELKNNPLDFIQLSMSFGTATKINAEEDMRDIIKGAEELMYFNKLQESKEATHNMINYLKEKLEKETFETKQHYERLKELSLLFANRLGLSEFEREELKLLCEYHDMGKVGIPYSILHKKEPLKKEEWNQIKRHSEMGYHIMRSVRKPVAVDELILIHHERWDGQGYPGLLKGEEIPITVRIFSIVDAYEAMVNDRPYRKQISHKRALEEISDKAGTQFDPIIAKIFVELMGEQAKVI